MKGYLNGEIECPFERIPMPAFEINGECQPQNLVNYFCTQSAFKLADDCIAFTNRNCINRHVTFYFYRSLY